jgi:1,4-alpha-glucan branching enzyme
MIKDPSGIFQIEIDLEPGTYDYKFIIDGRRWCYDILKPTKADERGNRNNVIIVDRGSGARGGVKKEVREVPKEAPKKRRKRRSRSGNNPAGIR